MNRSSALILVAALAGLSTPPADANQPKTPLTIEGIGSVSPDGLAQIDVRLEAREPLREVQLQIVVSAGDDLDVALSDGALRESGPPVADAIEATETHFFTLDIARSGSISFRVAPAAAKRHLVTVRALAPQAGHDVWGDAFSFYYSSEMGGLVIGWPQAEGDSASHASPGTLPADAAERAKTLRPGPVEIAPGPASATDGESTAGTVAVSGYWYMFDQTDSYIPQIERLVELVNTSGGVLASAYTDLGGYYAFPAVANPGAFYVRLWTSVNYNRAGGTDLLRMRNASGNNYFVTTATQSNVSDGNYYMGTWHLNNGDLNEGAYWAFNSIQETWRYFFFVHGDGNSYAGPMQAVWYPGSTEVVEYRLGEYIHLNNDAPRSEDTVAHEAGHNTMYNAYGGYWPPNDCPSPHYIDAASGIYCAWTEGWGDFVSLAVNGDSIYTFASGGSLDLENRGFWWASGDTVEGNVAGAMWDIIDANNEATNDFYTDWVGPLWDTLWNVNNGIFCSYWNSTRDYGVKRSRDNCLHQNTIDQCATCIEDPYENDDTCGAATFEGVPSTYTYEHCTDEDWQYASVALDWTYVWETNDLGYAGDTIVTIYPGDCSGGVLAFNDDKQFGNWPYASQVVWTSDRDGQVRVQAKQYASYGPHKSYDISLYRYCSSPFAASGISPADGERLCTSDVVMSWSGYGRTYDVYLDGSLACGGIGSTSCASFGLATGWHAWYVVSHNACGGSSYSATYSFQVLEGTVPSASPSAYLDPNYLYWTDVSDATAYDVIRGDLNVLQATGGDFAQATLECLDDDDPATSLYYPAAPEVEGTGWFFLLRGVGCAGNGSYDSGEGSQIGSRDAGVAASGLDCP